MFGTAFVIFDRDMKLNPNILLWRLRLTPLACIREQHPKPFIRLHDKQGLLQKVFVRGAVLGNVTEVMTVTNRYPFFKT